MRCLAIGTLALSFNASSALAQHATQVVRFSVTAATQGTIGSGNIAELGAATPAGTPSAAFGTSSGAVSAPEAIAKVPQTQLPPKAHVDAEGKTTFSSPEVTVTVWKANIAVASSQDNMKVAVSLDTPMPEGVDLTLEMGAAGGSESSGMVVLGTAGTDALTSMPKGSSPPIPLGFGIAGSNSNAGPRTVSFTLIVGA